MDDTNANAVEKVVIQFGTRTLRGYLEPSNWSTIEDVLGNAPRTSPETMRVKHIDSDLIEEISVKDVKAVFFVNSFEGDSVRNHINFHTRTPIMHRVWVQLRFLDGEVMEGILNNSIRYLIEPGFFLLPTDPGSNNKLIYVVKSSLVEFRVLGLRKL